MARAPSKILTASEAKASELNKQIEEQYKIVKKAEKNLEKEDTTLLKLKAKKEKAEAKKTKDLIKQAKKIWPGADTTPSNGDGGIGENPIAE